MRPQPQKRLLPVTGSDGKKHRCFEFVIPPLGGRFDGFRLKRRDYEQGAVSEEMGNPHEVSRKVAAWQRQPDKRMQSLLVNTPQKTQSLTLLAFP